MKTWLIAHALVVFINTQVPWEPFWTQQKHEQLGLKNYKPRVEGAVFPLCVISCLESLLTRCWVPVSFELKYSLPRGTENFQVYITSKEMLGEKREFSIAPWKMCYSFYEPSPILGLTFQWCCCMRLTHFPVSNLSKPTNSSRWTRIKLLST